MDVVLVAFAAFLASSLTLFSGFGLGTLLMPAIALFFPVEMAVAVTAVVHFVNNLAKLALVGRYADRSIVLWFGIPAFGAAACGAWLLGWLSYLPPLIRYSLLGHPVEIAPVKVVIAGLLVAFVLVELRGPHAKVRPITYGTLVLTGVLSGFFGGLSGHQGAFRSAYLASTALSKEQFVGTNVVIAALVDLSRLAVYGASLPLQGATTRPALLLITILAALAGTFLASRYIAAIRMETIRKLIAVMLIGVALGLGSGLI
jgi:uncharacterized membrane protein YfcA